jgi:hypothetical protein
MNGRQQLHTERRFKPFNQVCHPVKSSLRLGVTFQESFRAFRRFGLQFNLFLRIVFSIAISADEVTFNGAQDVTQIFCIRAVCPLAVF